jgi:hypothetical protein
LNVCEKISERKSIQTIFILFDHLCLLFDDCTKSRIN